jgi:hypothetical protein
MTQIDQGEKHTHRNDTILQEKIPRREHKGNREKQKVKKQKEIQTAVEMNKHKSVYTFKKTSEDRG